jgi:transcriptional regulator with XRE-family HTH domain
VGELHRAIANALAKKPFPLSGEEIRFLRKNIGIPAKKLAAVLGIAPETLSRIENGKVEGGLRAGLEHLVRLLARSASASESLREAVLEVADLLERQTGTSGRVQPIRLKPDNEGGWKAAA